MTDEKSKALYAEIKALSDKYNVKFVSVVMDHEDVMVTIFTGCEHPGCRALAVIDATSELAQLSPELARESAEKIQADKSTNDVHH